MSQSRKSSKTKRLSVHEEQIEKSSHVDIKTRRRADSVPTHIHLVVSDSDNKNIWRSSDKLSYQVRPSHSFDTKQLKEKTSQQQESSDKQSLNKQSSDKQNADKQSLSKQSSDKQNADKQSFSKPSKPTIKPSFFNSLRSNTSSTLRHFSSSGDDLSTRLTMTTTTSPTTSTTTTTTTITSNENIKNNIHKKSNDEHQQLSQKEICSLFQQLQQCSFSLANELAKTNIEDKASLSTQLNEINEKIFNIVDFLHNKNPYFPPDKQAENIAGCEKMYSHLNNALEELKEDYLSKSHSEHQKSSDDSEKNKDTDAYISHQTKIVGDNLAELKRRLFSFSENELAYLQKEDEQLIQMQLNKMREIIHDRLKVLYIENPTLSYDDQITNIQTCEKNCTELNEKFIELCEQVSTLQNQTDQTQTNQNLTISPTIETQLPKRRR